MDALIDMEYDDPICVDYFRSAFCNRIDNVSFICK